MSQTIEAYQSGDQTIVRVPDECVSFTLSGRVLVQLNGEEVRQLIDLLHRHM
jgi:hypothetical protein